MVLEGETLTFTDTPIVLVLSWLLRGSSGYGGNSMVYEEDVFGAISYVTYVCGHVISGVSYGVSTMACSVAQLRI